VPLTAKGEKIKAALEKEYGAKKGEQVLYAGRNSGTFAGVDADPIDRYMDAVRRGDAETMKTAFADGGKKKR
jgi:hypothetical protein